MLSPIMLSSSTNSMRIGLHLFSRTMRILLPACQPLACHTEAHYVELILSHPQDTQGRHRLPCLRRGLAHRRLPPRTAYGEESPRELTTSDRNYVVEPQRAPAATADTGRGPA